MVHLPEILVVSILHHSSIPSAIYSFTLLSSPVWALTESHALVEAASLEFNTFFWCCRLGSHDRPVPSPLTQLSFQPCWYNCGEMCENTGKGLWQKNSNSFYQHYNQIIHKKKHFHIRPNRPKNSNQRIKPQTTNLSHQESKKQLVILMPWV